mmetsp:Transcript_626/g.920  ORF Transcript_626/g.920 Transcript_626/m.920 type:complete len:276 (-) Transcript_626:76-903(-)
MKVYFEKQQSGLCAVHCLNTLLQGAYFTAVDLAQIARQFDETERQLMATHGTDTNDFLKYMAEDSANVADDGFYSVQVLQKALEVWNVSLIRSSLPEARPLMNNVTDQLAFVANQGEHWLTIRKFENGEFWNLNSLLEKPQFLSHFYLETYLSSLKASGYDIFIVQADNALPQPNYLLEGAGEWVTVSSTSNNSNTTTLTTTTGNDDSDTQPIVLDDDDDQDLATAIALSLSEPAHSQQQQSESSEQPTTTQQDTMSDSEDAELQAALLLSTQGS